MPLYNMQVFMRSNANGFALAYLDLEKARDASAALMSDNGTLAITDDYGHVVQLQTDDVSHVIVTDMDADGELAKYLTKKRLDAEREIQDAAALRGKTLHAIN